MQSFLAASSKWVRGWQCRNSEIIQPPITVGAVLLIISFVNYSTQTSKCGHCRVICRSPMPRTVDRDSLGYCHHCRRLAVLRAPCIAKDPSEMKKLSGNVLVFFLGDIKRNETRKWWNREALSFLMKNYNCRCTIVHYVHT